MKTQRVVILVSLVLAVSGCRYSKHPLPPEELRQLDGFSAGEEVILIDKAGERFPFHEGSRLTILPRPFGFRDVRFREIRVSGTELRGISENGGTYVVDLGKVNRAFVENVDPCRSALGGIGDGAVVAARVALITTLVAAILVGYGYALTQGDEVSPA